MHAVVCEGEAMALWPIDGRVHLSVRIVIHRKTALDRAMISHTHKRPKPSAWPERERVWPHRFFAAAN